MVTVTTSSGLTLQRWLIQVHKEPCESESCTRRCSLEAPLQLAFHHGKLLMYDKLSQCIAAHQQFCQRQCFCRPMLHTGGLRTLQGHAASGEGDPKYRVAKHTLADHRASRLQLLPQQTHRWRQAHATAVRRRHVLHDARKSAALAPAAG